MKLVIILVAIGLVLAAPPTEPEACGIIEPLIDFEIQPDTCGICDITLEFFEKDGCPIFEDKNLVLGLVCYEVGEDNERVVDNSKGIMALAKKMGTSQVTKYDYVGTFDMVKSANYDYWKNDFYAQYTEDENGNAKDAEPWLFWDNWDLIHHDEQFALFDDYPYITLTDSSITFEMKAVGGVLDGWSGDATFECWGYADDKAVIPTKLGEGWQKLALIDIPMHQCFTQSEIQNFAQLAADGYFDDMSSLRPSDFA